MQIDDDEDISTQKYSFEVYADHYTFYIEDITLSHSFDKNLLISGDIVDAWSGIIMVKTACYDTVPIEVIIQNNKPDNESFAEWDHVAEASIEIPSGNLYLVEPMTDYNKNKLICVIPGWYRARIHWAGISNVQDKKKLGEEYYKIIFWPEEYKPIQVLKGHRRDALLQNFGIDREVAQKIFAEIEAYYNEETRYYHTYGHISFMLGFIFIFHKELANPVAVQLAAWFHDVIYDTRAKDNEEKSAEYAEKVLSEVGVPGEVITRVKELVLATKSHQAPPDDPDCQIFLDCDLAILGFYEQAYDEYAKNIRLEYSWVAEEDYRRGRKQVLEKFLQRDRIFYVYNYEGQARRNLEREIASLG